MTSPPTRIDGIKLNASFVEGVAAEAICESLQTSLLFPLFRSTSRRSSRCLAGQNRVRDDRVVCRSPYPIGPVDPPTLTYCIMPTITDLPPEVRVLVLLDWPARPRR
jgi:hypothetical protein